MPLIPTPPLKLIKGPRIHPEDQLHTDSLTALAFNPSGTILASAGLDGRILFFNTSTGALIDVAHMMKRPFTSLVWLNNSRIVAGVSTGMVMSFKMLKNNHTCTAFPLHDSAVDSLAHQGYRIASAAGSQVYISTHELPETWAHSQSLVHPQSSCKGYPPVNATSVDWLSDSQSATARLLVVYSHHGVVIWDVGTSTMVLKIPRSDTGTLAQTAISLDRRFLVAFNSDDTTFDLFNLELLKKSGNLIFGGDAEKLCSTPFVPVVFTHGNDTIVSGDLSGKPVVWSLGHRVCCQRLNTKLEEENTFILLASHFDRINKSSLLAAVIARPSGQGQPQNKSDRHTSKAILVNNRGGRIYIWHSHKPASPTIRSAKFSVTLRAVLLLLFWSTLAFITGTTAA